MLDSVQHHLVADVPVGVFLSAGIDSSVIAALAAELGTQLRTVTLAFDEYAGTPDDEAPLAEATARLLRSDHATVRIGRDEFEELLDDFLACMDQPTIDGLNTYLVSRAAAKQGLKVALSGLGGDELFGGYPSFRQIPKLLKWGQRIPRSKSLGRAVQAAFRMLPLPGIPPKAAGLLSYSGDIAHAYLLRRALYLEDELDALLDESWLNEGLERLSTVGAITGTLSALSTAGATPHAQIAALESVGTCATSCCAIPIGRAWRMAWRCGCRLWMPACLNAWGQPLPRMRRRRSKTLRRARHNCIRRCICGPRPALAHRCGSGLRIKQGRQNAGCADGQITVHQVFRINPAAKSAAVVVFGCGMR